MVKKAHAKRIQRKIREALKVLEGLGFPRQQQNERSALTLLSLLDLKPGDSWASASDPLMGITPMISGPLAAARSRCARPLIGLRDVPMEFSRLRSRSAYQTPSSRPPSGFAPLGRLSREIAKAAIPVPNRRRLISQPVRLLDRNR